MRKGYYGEHANLSAVTARAKGLKPQTGFAVIYTVRASLPLGFEATAAAYSLDCLYRGRGRRPFIGEWAKKYRI